MKKEKTRICVVCNMEELEYNMWKLLNEKSGICYPCSDNIE